MSYLLYIILYIKPAGIIIVIIMIVVIIFMIIIPVTKNGIINDLDSQDLETDFRQLRGWGIA